MIETRARVVSKKNGMALVEAEAKSGCGHCDTDRGCGKASLSKLFFSKPRYFEVIDETDSNVGDEVTIGVSDGALFKSSIAVYVIPLVFLVFGAIFGNLFGPGDFYQATGAAFGLFSGFLVARRYSIKNYGNSRFQPFIIKRFQGR